MDSIFDRVAFREHTPIDARRFADLRLQLHHAAQLLAAGSIRFLSPEPDDSHTNLGWEPARREIVSRPLDGATLALRVVDPAILVRRGADSSEMTLQGTTLARLRDWLEDALGEPGIEWSLPFEILRHAVGVGPVSFDVPDTGVQLEFARYLDNGFRVLSAVAEARGIPSPRLWPHHFDVGVLENLATLRDGEAASVGAGFSPGDEHYDEPYFYVNPWPYPSDTATLGPLPSGAHWHTTGFVSAILPAHRYSGLPSSRDQLAAIGEFLNRATEWSRSLR